MPGDVGLSRHQGVVPPYFQQELGHFPVKILVIPDSHAKPGVTLRRYHWLGSLIVDEKPDVVVDLGDWADCDSLGHYDRGTKEFEGRRYAADVECAHAAREIVDGLMRKGGVLPRKIALCGNHCSRADRYANERPELFGKISSRDFAPKGWEWYPFLEEVKVGGIAFSHYFPKGLLGKPPGGERPALTMLNSQHRSCVAGHSHVYDFVERTAGKGKIIGLVAGCYVEPSWRPSYAGPSRDMWWNGIVVLDGVKGGYAEEVRRIDTTRIRKAYG